MSCQCIVCFNRKGSFISIIKTRDTSYAKSERGTQTGIDPATFEAVVIVVVIIFVFVNVVSLFYESNEVSVR